MVPGAPSPEKEISLHDDGSVCLTPRRKAHKAHGKKKDGRGSGENFAQNDKNVGKKADSATSTTTSTATSPITQRTLTGNLKEVAYRNFIVEKLHKKNYKTDFHGYTRQQALKELDEIIISLTYNMKRESIQIITIITGKGNHSVDGKAVIQAAVLDYVQKNDIKYHQEANNFGRIDVFVQKQKKQKNIVK